MSTADQPLHPIERAILSTLTREKDEFLTVEDLARESGLLIDQVRRGIEWLRAKNLIEVAESEKKEFSLGSEGQEAISKGLPERKLVELVSSAGGKLEISEAAKQLGEEFAIALGNSKKNGWIKVENNSISLKPGSEKLEPEELFLQKLASRKVTESDLSESELKMLALLRKRRSSFIGETTMKRTSVRLTELGAQIASTRAPEEIGAITPELLRSGEWKQHKLRALDVSSPSPKIFPGRRHPMRLFLNEVREAFVSLGFQEIQGSMSQSALWNFDALFIPQEHPAREMQDTFYISKVRADLSKYSNEVEAIRTAHESGGETGSMGWRYRWSEREASRVVLRTHTTAVTISYLAKYKPEEARVFSVGRVFRNEKPNYKHNPEFYQIEGVMVGEKLNLRNLIYTLSKFYSKLGFNEIKFWPTFFPYTEPSLQTMVFSKETGKWMELGGMGVFRPEVTIPLGVKNPVLAWGLSLDRLVMLRYGASDIRQLFGANLGWVRNLPITKGV